MSAAATATPTVVRTERGLSIAGTRITLYDVIDYLTAGWSPDRIRDRLNLSDQQVADVLAYIDTNRAQVDAEYQEVLRLAAENRRYWEERNRDRFERIASQPPAPEQEALRARLDAWKSKL